jgi:hypothetical protein
MFQFGGALVSTVNAMPDPTFDLVPGAGDAFTITVAIENSGFRSADSQRYENLSVVFSNPTSGIEILSAPEVALVPIRARSRTLVTGVGSLRVRPDALAATPQSVTLILKDGMNHEVGHAVVDVSSPFGVSTLVQNYLRAKELSRRSEDPRRPDFGSDRAERAKMQLLMAINVEVKRLAMTVGRSTDLSAIAAQDLQLNQLVNISDTRFYAPHRNILRSLAPELINSLNVVDQFNLPTDTQKALKDYLARLIARLN